MSDLGSHGKRQTSKIWRCSLRGRKRCCGVIKAHEDVARTRRSFVTALRVPISFREAGSRIEVWNSSSAEAGEAILIADDHFGSCAVRRKNQRPSLSIAAIAQKIRRFGRLPNCRKARARGETDEFADRRTQRAIVCGAPPSRILEARRLKSDQVAPSGGLHAHRPRRRNSIPGLWRGKQRREVSIASETKFSFDLTADSAHGVDRGGAGDDVACASRVINCSRLGSRGAFSQASCVVSKPVGRDSRRLSRIARRRSRGTIGSGQTRPRVRRATLGSAKRIFAGD